LCFSTLTHKHEGEMNKTKIFWRELPTVLLGTVAVLLAMLLGSAIGVSIQIANVEKREFARQVAIINTMDKNVRACTSFADSVYDVDGICPEKVADILNSRGYKSPSGLSPFANADGIEDIRGRQEWTVYYNRNSIGYHIIATEKSGAFFQEYYVKRPSRKTITPIPSDTIYETKRLSTFDF